MNPPDTLAARQRLRDLALARAHALRRQAIHDFWSGAARMLVHAFGRHRPPVNQPCEVA